MLRWCGVLAVAGALFGEPGLPDFKSATELEGFLLAPDEDGVRAAMQVIFDFEYAGRLVTAVQQYGPENASRAARIATGDGLRESYGELAGYLDRFGPCQKKLEGERSGWWSRYGEPPDESICSELVKLLYGAALWNQVEYCRQLAAGEVAPKTPVPEGRHPPYRLDEEPVKTVWIKPAVLYALADTALRVRLQSSLGKRVDGGRLQRACQQAATLLDQVPPNREAIAFALAQLLIRRWQALHEEHLERKIRPR